MEAQKSSMQNFDSDVCLRESRVDYPTTQVPHSARTEHESVFLLAIHRILTRLVRHQGGAHPTPDWG